MPRYDRRRSVHSRSYSGGLAGRSSTNWPAVRLIGFYIHARGCAALGTSARPPEVGAGSLSVGQPRHGDRLASGGPLVDDHIHARSRSCSARRTPREPRLRSHGPQREAGSRDRRASSPRDDYDAAARGRRHRHGTDPLRDLRPREHAGIYRWAYGTRGDGRQRRATWSSCTAPPQATSTFQGDRPERGDRVADEDVYLAGCHCWSRRWVSTTTAGSCPPFVPPEGFIGGTRLRHRGPDRHRPADDWRAAPSWRSVAPAAGGPDLVEWRRVRRPPAGEGRPRRSALRVKWDGPPTLRGLTAARGRRFGGDVPMRARRGGAILCDPGRALPRFHGSRSWGAEGDDQADRDASLLRPTRTRQPSPRRRGQVVRAWGVGRSTCRPGGSPRPTTRAPCGTRPIRRDRRRRRGPDGAVFRRPQPNAAAGAGTRARRRSWRRADQGQKQIAML
jgi:hypothetical protein